MQLSIDTFEWNEGIYQEWKEEKIFEDDLTAVIKPQYLDQISTAEGVKGSVQKLLDNKDRVIVFEGQARHSIKDCELKATGNYFFSKI